MIKQDRDQYWASAPSNEIADRILDKVEDYYEYCSQSGRLDLWRRSWSYYYRARVNGGMLSPAGQQGELTTLAINDYRNLLLHLENMTTQQPAVFEPVAANSDVESQSQVILSAGLLDYYMREKRLNRNVKRAVKESLIFGEGFVQDDWDATLGKSYGMTPAGTPAYEGDVKYSNYTPFDCIRDFTQLSAEGAKDWQILRDFKNKFDLAAKFPDLKEQIVSDSSDFLEMWRTTTLDYLWLEESDNIAVYKLLHKRTPALPQGRYALVLDNGTVLMDGPIPYKDGTHVHRISPDEEEGSIFGYTTGFDLLPVQEAKDILTSTAITNQATFGVQNVLVPKGHDLSTSQLSGGLNVMECDFAKGKPESLNLTQTPAELFNFMEYLDRKDETISGVNSVARGNPEASLKSGAALALVQSMAVQFSMGLQQSYAELIEDLGTSTIQLLQQFAAVPRIAEIAGKSNRPLMREFKGSDLSLINRVHVDMGNPLTKTTSGKVNLADTYLEHGMVENPDQYLQVVTTGRLEPLIEGKQADILLIKGENEQLSDGKPQRALITDNHAKHILEHKTVLANPEIRSNPNDPIVQNALAHIQEHLMYAQSPGYQVIAAMLGHQVMTPMVQPQPGGGAGGMLNNAPPVVQQAQGVNPPSMPNPPAGTDQQSAEVINGMSA